MPSKPRESSVDDEEQRETFLKDLAEYHEKRGTVLDSNPKVGPRYIDLFKLYQRVTSEGGYDKASDTRSNKLAWRRIASEFLPNNANIVQLAFQVKTVYYKNLAAYEISTFHKKEPPPIEILEALTAKGGDLLNRTVENYARQTSRETKALINGQESDDSENENSTPKEDRMDLDEPTSTSGRVTRALRQAPPQRVLFGQQSDTPARQTRSAGTHQNVNSPTPGGSSNHTNGAYTSNGGASVSIVNYDPRPIAASTVKAIVTPSNNPNYFREFARRQKERLRRNRGIEQARGMMLPGTGFTGPNIYMRCLRALESGIPDEVKYALHHLVKISHERGDKFRFDQFVNLADALMHTVCSVSTVWYSHPGWEYSMTHDGSDRPNLLNELIGTDNLIQKINSYQPLHVDNFYTDQWRSVMSDVNQAGLVLRNMAMLEDNARFLSDMALVKDMMTIILQLPKRAETIEIKYYALEVAEQLTKYWVLGASSPLYTSLIETVENNIYDRGMIIVGLRALSRISMNLDVTNRLEAVPVGLLEHVYQWLLVDDEDLRGACLDFLYQYTAVTENIQFLMKALNTEALVEVLMHFLMLGAVRVPLHHEQESNLPTPKPSSNSEALPKLAPSIIEQLCLIADPREQSTVWLRTCFVEDPVGEITQLALWSSYKDSFSGSPSQNTLMQAKDFITNVTAVFPKAVARVVPDESDRSRSKYTMKGISPRAEPTDLRGRPYVRCLWRTPLTPSTESSPPINGDPLFSDCDLWFSSAHAEELWTHIVDVHMEVPRDPDNPKKFRDGLLRGSGRKFACMWSGCNRYPLPGVEDAYKVCMHVKSHLPDHGPGAAHRAKYTRDPNRPLSPPRLDSYYLNTPTDEQGHPIGLPLAGILVLRNLARQMLKLDDNNPRRKTSLIERHFSLHQEKIFHVMTYNYSLRQYTPEFIHYVSRGLEEAHKHTPLAVPEI